MTTIEALRELVALKDLKERLRKLHEMGCGTDYDDYHKRQPLAWDAARAALAAHDAQGVNPTHTREEIEGMAYSLGMRYPGAQPAAQPPLCMCKDRPLSECPGEWEPGCDLGNNPAYVRVWAQPAAQPSEPTEEMLKAGQEALFDAAPDWTMQEREDLARIVFEAMESAGSQPAAHPPCIGNDPLCPCQDGLACHYKDYPGSKGWPHVS
jgi:hypothetical protein